MKKIRLLPFIEFLVWFIILALCVLGIRMYRYHKFKEMASYQIFIPDVNGIIVGSPVRYLGVQSGYVQSIKLLKDTAYVRFVITTPNLKLPKGVIVTIEEGGLGGSKHLELYPPDKNESTENLIVVRPPVRLNDAAGLLGDMFAKIDSIIVRCTHFANKMGAFDNDTMDVNIDPDEIGKGLEQADRFMDVVIDKRNEFKSRFWRLYKNEQE